MKVSLKPETAAAFKTACAANDVSMTSVISQFIAQYCGIATKKGGYSPDLSTKRQRRAALRSIIHLLDRIKTNEEQYQDNIPDNLQGSMVFQTAEDTISALNDAIDLLETAY
jgi:hypothetical protein